MSLCVLLPVYNAQRSLPSQLTTLLDLLPELTSRWRIVVQDRGSRDATSEIAAEFISLYPQIQWMSQSSKSSATDDWRNGLKGASEDAVVYRSIDSRADLRDLASLWRRLSEAPIVSGRATSGIGSIPPILGQRATPSIEDADMIFTRRSIWSEWKPDSRLSAWNYLRESNFGVVTVELRMAPAPLVAPMMQEEKFQTSSPHAPLQRAPTIAPMGSNYFSRLKRMQSR